MGDNRPIYFQVRDLSREEARVRIKRLIKVYNDVSRRSELRKYPRVKSVVYDSGCLRMQLPFTLAKVRDPTVDRVKCILKTLLDLNQNNEFLSKRGFYYKLKDVFKDQRSCDTLIDDICCLIGATRRCLGVVASPNGLVIGSLEIRQNGKLYDLRDCEPLGHCISPHMSEFKIVSCKARFILVIEKQAYFSQLVERKFHKTVDCLLITGLGIPDMATRYFLRNLTKQINIPVFGLVDCDPAGIKILCTYTFGSENAAFDCENLVTPGIKWLGVRPSDLDKYQLRWTDFYSKEYLDNLEITPFILDKSSWVDELQIMMEEMRLCDLGSLSPDKLLQKVAQEDWLNNEVQVAQIQPKGSRYELKISSGDRRIVKEQMLNLRVVKSETATIKIPQLELEIFPNAERESLSTVEWILLREFNDLQAFKNERKNVDLQTLELIGQSIARLQEFATGKSSFTFILDDPAGNSFIEQPRLSKSRDSAFVNVFYERSREQQASLGYPVDPTQWSEVMAFINICSACFCETREPSQLRMSNIPYFQDGIIMTLICDSDDCGYHNFELKTGGAIPPKGKKVSFSVQDISDLSRVIIKSDTASVRIPELDLELVSGTLGDVKTTVEGLLFKISEVLKKVIMVNPDDDEERWEDFTAGLDQISNVEVPWTLIIDDALANSSIATTHYDIEDDEQLTIEEYERSFEQNEELGLNDMDTSSADAVYRSILSIHQFYHAFDRTTEGPGPNTIPEYDQRWVNIIQNWNTSM